MPATNLELHDVISILTDPMSGLLGSKPMYVREVARRARDMKLYQSSIYGQYYSWKKNDPADVFIADAPIGWGSCVAALKTLTNKTRTLTHAPKDLTKILEHIFGRQFVKGSTAPTAVFIENPLSSYPNTGGLTYVPNHVYLLTGRFEDDKRYRTALHTKINDIARASAIGFRNARNWEKIAYYAISAKAFPSCNVSPSHFNSPEPDILVPEKMLAIEVTTRNTNPLDEDYLTAKLRNIPPFYDLFMITPVWLTGGAGRFIPHVKISGYLIEGSIHIRYFPNKPTVESLKQDAGVIGGVNVLGPLDGFAVVTPRSNRAANILKGLHRRTKQYTRAEMEEWVYRAVKDMFFRLSMNVQVIYRRLFYLNAMYNVPVTPKKVLYRHAEAFLQDTLDMTPLRIEKQMIRLKSMGWIDYKDKRHGIEFRRKL